MKKAILYAVTFIAAILATDAKAQNVVMNAYIDTMEIRIGEQTKIRLEFSVDSGYTFNYDSITKSFPANIEVLKEERKAGLLNDGRRHIYTNEYTITSFDSTLYMIPPFKAKLNGTEYTSNELYLNVGSVPIDTANLQNIAGPKSIRDIDLSWEEYRDTIYLSFLLLFLAALLAWVIVRLVKNKPIIRIIKIKPRKPSHVAALDKFEEIKNDKELRLGSNAKEYYTRLTDTLREYMNNRFGFNATEMTTPEIIDHLRSVEDKEGISELKEVLEIADLVKFAKLNPAMNENDRNLLCAIDFINRTKNIEEEKNQQPTEKRVVNERSMTQKRILVASIVVVAIVLVGIAVLLVTDVSNMLL